MLSLDRFRRPTRIALFTMLLAVPVAERPARAQQPPTTGAAQASLHRAPTITLVQPTGTGTVPRDRPIIVFRFAPGEIDDPIDARSFTIAVDGVDRSARFQIAGDAAWGSLAGAAPDDSLPGIGPHAVHARICSVRGLCGQAEVAVTVGDGAVPGTPPTQSRSSDRQPSARARLIEILLDAARRIFVP